MASVAKAQSKGESDGHGAVRGRSGLAYFPLAVHGLQLLGGAGGPASLSRRQVCSPAGRPSPHTAVPWLCGPSAPRPPSAETSPVHPQRLGQLGSATQVTWRAVPGTGDVKKPSPHFRPQRRAPVPSLAIRPGENRGLPRALPSRPVQLGLTRGRSAPRTPG